jgi:hypothetical protein
MSKQIFFQLDTQRDLIFSFFLTLACLIFSVRGKLELYLA